MGNFYAQYPAASSGGGGGGDATAANQVIQISEETAIAASVASLDSKTVAVNTGAVVLAAGNAHVGSIGGALNGNQFVPTITAGSYSIGFCIGGLITFSSAYRQAGASAILQSMAIVDNDQQNANLDIYVFVAAPTVPTDHTAFNPSFANLQNCSGIIKVTGSDWSNTSSRSVASLANIGIPCIDVSNSNVLCFVIVAQSTPTYTTTSSIGILPVLSLN